MKKFTPEYFIGVGETNAYYTLRVTAELHIPSEGPDGNSVINGVYQGTILETDYYVRNLSQDANEAYTKAVKICNNLGRKLRTNGPEHIADEMREIKKRTADEMEAARIKADALAAERHEAMMSEQARKQAEMLCSLENGIVSFGKYKNNTVDELPQSYIQWLGEANDFDSFMSCVRDIILAKRDYISLPTPKKDLYIGEPKKRDTYSVQIIKAIGYEGYYGYQRIYQMVDLATKALMVSFTGSFLGEVGDVMTIKATVKGHDEYKGQAQTVVQRIAVQEAA